ncbi:MAG: immunoglobulin domain-containing protein [Lacunisphaera sp.]
MKTISRFHLRSILPIATLAAAAAANAATDYATPYVFSTLAGTSSIGSNDGPGTVARFYSPRAVAVDQGGNVYVADAVNNTIRKITPAGIVSTLAGTPGVFSAGMPFSGSMTPQDIDGTGKEAKFANPEGIAVDPSGTIYVADKMVSVIRKVSPAGAVTTWAGYPPASGSTDGTGATAKFFIPGGLAIDTAGNVYVAEWVTHIIRKITPAGVVTTLAGLAGKSGSIDGTGSEARFFQPTYLAVDRAGIVYVTDTINCTIRKIMPDGVVTTLAGLAGSQGSADGTGITARFNRPTGIAVDQTGNVYVSDAGNYTLRKITPAGVVSTLAGSSGLDGSTDGTGAAARFRGLIGLAADAEGNIYGASDADNTIRKITPAGIVTTLAGLGRDFTIGSNDGIGTSARFNALTSTAVGPQGELYAADSLNATIRKISPNGTVSTLAGSPGHSGSIDGTGSAARFYIPSGVAVDPTGNVYVADSGNNTIRKITPASIVTTFAGTGGVYGSADGTGSAAQFFYPYAMAADQTGTLYVTEIGNYAIRKITPAGVVTTLAGAAGQPGSADGIGSAARFRSPEGIAVDGAGNVYVADKGNNAIRKISPAGVVTTLPFTGPITGTLTVDAAGTLFMAGSTVDKVTTTGEVSTLAGLSLTSGNADGLGREVRFKDPQSITVSVEGTLYVTSESTVRKGVPAGPPVITTQPASQSVAVGSGVKLSVAASGAPEPSYQWYFGSTPFSGATSNTLNLSDARSADAGDYTVVVSNELGSATSNKATLTVSPAPATPPSPSPSNGSGGGGGSIEGWFALVLLGLGAARSRRVGKGRVFQLLYFSSRARCSAT